MAAALVIGAAAAPAAAAETVTVDATYTASLGGFTFAGGTLHFTLAGNTYDAQINAGVTGIAALIASRSAIGGASGRVTPGRVSPDAYALSIAGGTVPNDVALTFSDNRVTSISASELHLAGWDNRIPLTPQHKQGVVDPFAAFIVPMQPGKDPMTPAVCNRTLRIFDGRVRYDLRLVYGAKTDVTATEPGSYSGPAIVCAVAYRPIAGHRILSAEQQRFENNIEFSIWFVPVGQTGILLPHRVLIQTQSGMLIINATRFVVNGSQPVVAANDPEPAKPHVWLKHRRHRHADEEPAPVHPD
ncbi:MAG: DUF3108 domain-containing protein [Ancalomicrobiaceae bacterium]|nr:DUF3108 domain-containing protein [Ancalomicrobiaceae bacterium]